MVYGSRFSRTRGLISATYKRSILLSSCWGLSLRHNEKMISLDLDYAFLDPSGGNRISMFDHRFAKSESRCFIPNMYWISYGHLSWRQMLLVHEMTHSQATLRIWIVSFETR